MAQLFVIRHGQASFGADNYDNLSELGHQQSRWLGEHLSNLGETFDRVLVGEFQRQQQTVQGILEGLGQSVDIQEHKGLNEYSSRGLLNQFYKEFRDEWHKTGHARRDYAHNMNRSMKYWIQGKIATDGHDSWVSFCERIHQALQAALDSQARRVLVVTSGGPVSVILGKVLALDDMVIRDVFMRVKNSSVSKLLYNGNELSLDSFNDVSHLQVEGRHKSITFA